MIGGDASLRLTHETGMRQFFLTLAGVFAGLTLFAFSIFAFFIVLTASVQSEAGERLAGVTPDVTVLDIDLRRALPDQASATPFSAYRPPSLIALVEALARAERDPRVMGAYIRASEAGLTPAHAEEIHDALLSLREHGKFVITHAQGFEGTSITSYFAAAASDEIWIQPTSNFVATGLAVETPFFGGVFEKFGVRAELEQFHEYKNAVNTYTETGYTEAHREATLALLESIYEASIERSAKARRDRGMTPELLRSLLEGAPYSAEDAVALGLADTLGHVIEAREEALARAGEDAELMDVFAYLRATGRPYNSGPVIAVIAGQGDVLTGELAPSYFGAASGVYSDTIADALIAAAEDDDVRAIVLRIDSPGGSAIASDQVWDAVARARAAGKPVVASFGAVAASGGYYLAVGSDTILASATTITGSIGVYGGKLVLDEAFDKVGFNLEPLGVGGEFSLAYASTRSFTAEQRAAFRSMLAEVYEDFTGKVADGRGLSREAVEASARGRVWSGEDALSRGLIDEIGGYRDAIDAAKELAGIDAEDNVTVRSYPSEPSPFAFFQALFGVSIEGARTLHELQALADGLELAAVAEARDRLNPDMLLLAPQLDVR
jgi:protease-4